VKMEVNLNDEWVDEIVAASLRQFIRRHHSDSQVPVAEMKTVLEFYTVKQDYDHFMEEIHEIEDIHRHQERFDF
jgi:hypothetical protein